MVGTGVTDYKVYARALLKVTYIHAQTLFHVEFQNNYKSLYLQDIRFTAKIHSIYRYMIKCIIFTDILIKKTSRCTQYGPGFSFKTIKLGGTDKIT